ncbi:MAG: hypothetical protein KC561_16055, partial [Myxococcales bacterium]|nr:hypothetical protein [Myxococcales bacterium]
VLPEIDDDFAAEAGDVETVADLKDKIRGEIEAQRERDNQGARRKELEDKLIETHEFELPQALLKSQIEEELSNQLRYFQQSGFNPEQLGMSVSSMRERLSESVERRLKLEFILRAIAEREKVDVTEADLKSQVEQVIRSAGAQAQQAARYYSQPNNLAGLRERVLLDKTLDFLLGKATIPSDGEGGTETAESKTDPVDSAESEA